MGGTLLDVIPASLLPHLRRARDVIDQHYAELIRRRIERAQDLLRCANLTVIVSRCDTLGESPLGTVEYTAKPAKHTKGRYV
jgi:hypothetical protein